MVDFLAVEPVPDANLDSFEPIEDVELGQGEPGNAAGPHRLAHQHGVEPAAAALASGVHAELLAAPADLLADCVMQFGRERSLADAGRVRLAYAQHVTDRARAHAGARCSLRRNRVGGGHVRVSAMIHVQQRTLRTLEQNTLTLATLQVEQPPYCLGIGEKL